MQMERIMVQIPRPLKAKLDALRRDGTTASGLIRSLLNQHFQVTSTPRPQNRKEVS